MKERISSRRSSRSGTNRLQHDEALNCDCGRQVKRDLRPANLITSARPNVQGTSRYEFGEIPLLPPSSKAERCTLQREAGSRAESDRIRTDGYLSKSAVVDCCSPDNDDNCI